MQTIIYAVVFYVKGKVVASMKNNLFEGKKAQMAGALYKKRRRLAAFLLCAVFLAAALPAANIQGANLKLYYYNTKKTVSYANAQISYIYNDKKISLDKTPGILTENGVALGPYYEIFSKSLGVSCKKDSKNNTITFKKGDTTLVLTLYSRTALLNGQAVTMNAEPISIRYADSKTSRILVPTRFVAESLGYDYHWDSSTSTVTIKNGLTLFYNNKQVSYRGTIGKVVFDGQEVSVAKLPTILISNTAMLRAYTVFKKAMGVKYAYNSDTGKITFKQGDLTLSMQEGSTTAYLNGEARDCGVAPVLMKNMENGTEALMVPGRFVAESLGYNYIWDAQEKVSRIQTTSLTGVYIPPVQAEEPQPPVNQPEEPPEQPEEQVYYSFVVDEQKYLEFENIIDGTTTEIDRGLSGGTSFINNIYRDDNEVFNEKYVVEFASPVTKIDTLLEQNKLTVTVRDAISAEKDYTRFYGSLVSKIYQYSTSGSTILEFDLAADYPYYNLALSEDGLSCEITIYPNYLVGLEVGVNSYGNYMRFKGLQAIQYELGEEGGYQAVYFHNTANTLGNIIFPDEFFDSFFEYAVMLETDPDQIKMVYKTEEGTILTIQEQANELYFYFNYETAEEEVPTPTANPEPNASPQPTIPINSPIQVSLPDEVSYSSVASADQYMEKKIVITIPGEHEEFYNQHPLQNTYTAVENISIETKNGSTIITISTLRIQGFFLSKTADGFSITIGSPSSIYDKIIVLDAGHGGIDPGASAGGYNEKDLNFKILNEYTKNYFEGSGIKVYFTRLTDVKIDLYKRADFATQVEADMFVSLHMNAFSSTSTNGTAVYYSTLNKSINSGGLTSKAMVSSMVSNLSKALGTKNNGVQTADFVVIRETEVPAILIELAFLTNASDRKIITTQKTQELAAKTIYETCVSFFNAYPTGR